MAEVAAAETITPLFSAAEIAARVDALARDIAASSPPDLIIVAILKGSFIFAADLIRALHREGLKPEIDFIFLASYGTGTVSGGEVKVLRDVETELSGLRQGPARTSRRPLGQDLHPDRQASAARRRDRSRLCRVPLPAGLCGGLRHGPRPPLSRAALYRQVGEAMTALTLIAAVLGALIPPVVIAQALRSKAEDRWPEGLLVGAYLGALGALSLIFLIGYFR
jgi:hypothetical protein